MNKIHRPDSKRQPFHGLRYAKPLDLQDERTLRALYRNHLEALSYVSGALNMVTREAPRRTAARRPARRTTAKRTATASTDPAPEPPQQHSAPDPGLPRLTRDPGETGLDFIARVLLGALARASTDAHFASYNLPSCERRRAQGRGAPAPSVSDDDLIIARAVAESRERR